MDSNALNTDGLASVTFTINDLGLSGDGGPLESDPFTIDLVFMAINDGPLLNLPGPVEAHEDTPTLVSKIVVLDADCDESGGEASLSWGLRMGFASGVLYHASR